MIEMFVPRSIKVAAKTKKKNNGNAVKYNVSDKKTGNTCVQSVPNTGTEKNSHELIYEDSKDKPSAENSIILSKDLSDKHIQFNDYECQPDNPDILTDKKDVITDIKHCTESKSEEIVESHRPLIKSYSKQQRWPDPEEPSCVVCGRYGEYICDQTEEDVCSLECKARHLAGIKPSSEQVQPDEHCEPDNVQDVDVNQDLLDMGPSRCTAGYSYKEHKTLSSLTNEQVHELRNQVSIFVEGLNIPRPITEFSHLNLPKTMACNLKTSGYKSPTPVQMQTIPAALVHHDLMVCAQTSSGKTASFLIPTTLHIYNEVHKKEQRHKPVAIILTPTRELAMQIEAQAKQIMKGLQNMKTALIVGGLPLPPQIHRLQQAIQLVIATPGRLLEIIDKNAICLDYIKVLTIDEVDSMLKMGFQDQVMDIMKKLPDDHQTMLFSATIPRSIESLASSLLHEPVYISIGTPNTPSSSVKHMILWVEDPSKKKKLFAILQDPKYYKPPLVIFVDSKLGCEMLAQTIRKMCGYKVATLHGDKSQVERSQTLNDFLQLSLPVMVCTAVLGRGIDLVGVKLVINFDMPNTVEEYIHQIGRTGRLGGAGTAVSFINNTSKHIFLEFVTALQPLGIQLPIELCNSPHLHLQREKHERKRKSNKFVFARKRKHGDAVKDVLQKKNWKIKF